MYGMNGHSFRVIRSCSDCVRARPYLRPRNTHSHTHSPFTLAIVFVVVGFVVELVNQVAPRKSGFLFLFFFSLSLERSAHTIIARTTTSISYCASNHISATTDPADKNALIRSPANAITARVVAMSVQRYDFFSRDNTWKLLHVAVVIVYTF